MVLGTGYPINVCTQASDMVRSLEKDWRDAYSVNKAEKEVRRKKYAVFYTNCRDRSHMALGGSCHHD